MVFLFAMVLAQGTRAIKAVIATIENKRLTLSSTECMVDIEIYDALMNRLSKSFGFNMRKRGLR